MSPACAVAVLSAAFPVAVSAGFVLGLAATVVLANTNSASAAQAPVSLGTAASFGVLAGSTVTNTGPSVITGDVGVSPGSAMTGFPPGGFSGVTHAADGVALTAQNDLTTAYNDAAGRTPVIPTATELAGRTLQPGVYSGDTLGLTGAVTLDAGDNPDAVFVFLAASPLITGSASVVALLNGANPCNVYWKVGSSATLGTGSTFKGNLMALTSITATTGALISGRLLARNGAVTLDDNVINRDGCTESTTTSTAASSSTGASSPVGGGTSSTPGGGVSTTPIGGPGIPFRTPGDVDLGQHNSSAHAEHRTVNLALRPAAAPFPDRRQRRWHRDLGRDVHRARRRHPRAGAQSRRTPRTPALTVPVPACLPFQPVARS